MPADIDEANATITMSINADPAKRANWKAISTNQITTTYTGTGITPSSTTLDLSNDNDNVATYTVTNADGKSKVYTLKVEFASFKLTINTSTLSTPLNKYTVEVYSGYSPSTLLSTNTIEKNGTLPLSYTNKDYIAIGTNLYVYVFGTDDNGSSVYLSAFSDGGVSISSNKTANTQANVLQQCVVILSVDFSTIPSSYNLTRYGNVITENRDVGSSDRFTPNASIKSEDVNNGNGDFSSFSGKFSLIVAYPSSITNSKTFRARITSLCFKSIPSQEVVVDMSFRGVKKIDFNQWGTYGGVCR